MVSILLQTLGYQMGVFFLSCAIVWDENQLSDGGNSGVLKHYSVQIAVKAQRRKICITT